MTNKPNYSYYRAYQRVEMYLHGDLLDDDSGQYFCAYCDAFVDADHFTQCRPLAYHQRRLMLNSSKRVPARINIFVQMGLPGRMPTFLQVQKADREWTASSRETENPK